MHAYQKTSVSALAVALWSATAVAQIAGTDTGMDAAERQAAGSLPFLIDHPEILRQLESKIWQQRQATDDGVNPPPGVPSSRTVRVTPGMPEAMNEINTIYGMPTSIVFIDITGAPWPIQWELKTNEYVKPAANAATPTDTKESNNPEPRRENTQNQNPPDPLYAREAQHIADVTTAHGFQFEVPNVGPSGNTLNVITISPSPIGATNVFLQGARAPIPLKLRSVGPRGGDYDAVVTVQVMAHGPQAKAELAVHDEFPETGQSDMFAMLQGHPPADAIPLDVMNLSPDRIRAWRRGTSDYLLTDVIILAPQPQDSQAGNGVSIYKIPDTPSVTVFDRDTGRSTSIQLRDRS